VAYAIAASSNTLIQVALCSHSFLSRESQMNFQLNDDYNNEQIRVQLPTYADDVALPVFASNTPLLPCSNRPISPARRAHSSKRNARRGFV